VCRLWLKVIECLQNRILIETLNLIIVMCFSFYKLIITHTEGMSVIYFRFISNSKL